MEHSIAERKSGVGILFITTLVIAWFLVVERFMADNSNFEELGSSTFNELLMATYPFIEVLLPFRIGYAVEIGAMHLLEYGRQVKNLPHAVTYTYVEGCSQFPRLVWIASPADSRSYQSADGVDFLAIALRSLGSVATGSGNFLSRAVFSKADAV